MADVHFEVFRQQGKGGGWSLTEAFKDREQAIAAAKDLLGEGRASAVRVVKETLQSNGDYLSLTIFEDGKMETQKKNKKTEDIESPVPCFKPDDLYSYHARLTISRILGDWLSRQRLTVIELLHSASALEKLEATGTTFQHGIQKIAVAQASESNFPVAQIIKQLNELCTTAIHRVYKDEKKNAFPKLEAGKFGALAQKLGASLEARYILNGALAKYLANAKGWDEKLLLLLALMNEIPQEGPGRTLLLTTIDSLVAEMLNGSAALAELLGHNSDLGHALLNLVELFLGTTVNTAEGSGHGLNDLARYFAKDDLPEARTAIAGRILSELKGMKRLCPASLEEEFKMLRRLGNQLVRGQGKYLSNEDLIGAFTERSKRLVTHEPLLQFMADCKAPDEKVERLLIVEENIIGAENKRTLSTFILPIISSNGFEAQLVPTGTVMQRLRRIAEIQERVLRSGFQDVQKSQIAVALDGVAVRIEERGRFLASIETRFTNPVERAQAILKLTTAGMFTQGDMMLKVRRLLMGSLAKPGFLASYIAHAEQEKPGDRNALVTELTGQLEGIGITQEEAYRAFAA
jgi:hypothetical protein